MNRFTLIGRSLVYYRRMHLGVGAGAAVAAAVLVGALLVGQSVRLSLQQMALDRLGATHLAMHAGDRLFRDTLADELSQDMKVPVAPVLLLNGSASVPDGSQRALRVQVVGVDQRFWSLGRGASSAPSNGVILNRALAAQLAVGVGDAVVVSFANPGLLSADVAIVNEDRGRLTLRLKVTDIVDADRMGRFGLEATHVVPMSAFVALPRLQAAIDAPGRTNTLLVGGGADMDRDAAQRALAAHWQLADAQLELVKLDDPPCYELHSDRVFFHAPRREPHGKAIQTEVLTYLVNSIERGDRVTPYSMICASDAHWLGDLEDDQIIINQWLAEDLNATVGDIITIEFYDLAGPQRLVKSQARFEVARIVPMDKPWIDRTLMPAFPGVAEADSARDWDPGAAIDLSRIRDKDDEYWEKNRGSPKAFITIAAGHSLWSNRFGDVTAVRFSSQTVSVEEMRDELSTRYRPSSLGLVFRDVRSEALAASREGPAAYFGSMFIGFSVFIIASAILLMSVLFVFSVEQRAAQAGLMLAVGYTGPAVRRLLFGEGAVVALIGTIVGSALAVGYTCAVLWGLTSVWADAVNHAALAFHGDTDTLFAGAAGSFAVALSAIWFALRKQSRQQAHDLLSRSPSLSIVCGSMRRSAAVMVSCLVGASGLAVTMLRSQGAGQAGAFFGAGVLLLVAVLAGTSCWLTKIAARSTSVAMSLVAMGRTNVARRRGRSLAVVALMACGTFLVAAVGANRKQPDNLEDLAGPAGGFALYARSSVPIYEGLDRRFDGDLDPKMRDAFVVPMRLAEGDDASCLNLNRARQPRLLGVNPERLAGRFRFMGEGGWMRLQDELANADDVPAIADQSTAVWGLGQGVGDRMEYIDETGQAFNVVIVGIIEDSILQGSLIVDENCLLKKYPSISGYQIFLVQTSSAQATREYLAQTHRAAGLEVSTSRTRLESFMSVQNTYLSIFTALGGIGLVLGTVGLGVIVLRNVLERRKELAVLRAMGYRKRQLGRMLIVEHGVLIMLGLSGGLGAAVLAVLPALTHAPQAGPLLTIGLMLGLVVISAVGWLLISTRIALAGALMDTLAEES